MVCGELVNASPHSTCTSEMDNVEMICNSATQTPVLVQAYDFIAQRYLDVALTLACDLE